MSEFAAKLLSASREQLIDEVLRLRGEVARVEVAQVEKERDALRDGLRWALLELEDEAWAHVSTYLEDKHRDVKRENELRALVYLEPLAKEHPDE